MVDLEYKYVLKPKDYMLDFDIRSQGLNAALNTSKPADFHWDIKTYRNEKSISYENRYAEILFEYEDGKDNYVSQGKDEEETPEKVTYIAYKQHFFTSVFKSETMDESKYAELVSKKVKGIYKTVEPTAGGLFKELETLVYSQDVPIWDTSTYAQFKVMQLAKENEIKVVLDGQGADELFAGYHHHYVAKWNNLFKTGKRARALKDIGEKIVSEVKSIPKDVGQAALESVGLTTGPGSQKKGMSAPTPGATQEPGSKWQEIDRASEQVKKQIARSALEACQNQFFHQHRCGSSRRLDQQAQAQQQNGRSACDCLAAYDPTAADHQRISGLNRQADQIIC